MPPSLGRVPFLLGLEPTVIDKLLGNALLLECDAGETLIIEGDDSKFFCILLKGSMDVIKDGKKIKNAHIDKVILNGSATPGKCSANSPSSTTARGRRLSSPQLTHSA